jgi:hypothetical protein
LPRQGDRVRGSVLATLALTTVLGCLTSAEAATSIVVNTDQDPNTFPFLTSLRDAVDQANANPLSDSVITFAPGLAGKTITLHAGELSITRYMRIVGPGAGTLTISGNNASRIFHMIGPSNTGFPMQVFVSGLTLTNAASPANQGGGAIDAEGETSLYIQDSVISNSHAAVGAAIAMTGRWAKDFLLDKYDCFGDLTVTRSVISGNSADLSGGGILAGYCTRTNVYDSTIVGNSAYDYGGGLFASSGFYLQVATSLITGNTVGGQASPLMGGAGIAVKNIYYGTAIRDSTISGNIALAEGGGLAILDTYGNTRIYSSTITGNYGYNFAGQGIASTGGTVTLVNSIVANNSSRVDDEDLAGTFSSDHSLIKTPGSSASVSGAGNIFGKDPVLGPLHDNGGPTLTMLPAIGSPAIDAGSADTTVDQRGSPRPAGAGYDMGAVERQYPEQLVFRASFDP